MSANAQFTCGCGRNFNLENAFSIHQRACDKTKKRLATVLSKGKEILAARKRRRLEDHSNDIFNKATKVTVTPESVLSLAPLPSSSTDSEMNSNEVFVKIHFNGIFSSRSERHIKLLNGACLVYRRPMTENRRWRKIAHKIRYVRIDTLC